jgi:hypothetical protein
LRNSIMNVFGIGEINERKNYGQLSSDNKVE